MNITWTRPRSLQVELPEGIDITSLLSRVRSVDGVAGAAAMPTILTVGFAHNTLWLPPYSKVRKILVDLGIITPNIHATRAYKVPAR